MGPTMKAIENRIYQMDQAEKSSKMVLITVEIENQDNSLGKESSMI